MLGGLREEGPSLNTVFADYLTHADLTKYAVINPNSRKISISSANFAALNKKKNAEDTTVNPVNPVDSTVKSSSFKLQTKLLRKLKKLLKLQAKPKNFQQQGIKLHMQVFLDWACCLRCLDLVANTKVKRKTK